MVTKQNNKKISFEKETKMNNSTNTQKNQRAKKINEEHVPQIKFIKLFRLCNKTDYFIMVIGTLGAIANGIIMPALALILGSAILSFDPRNGPDTIVSEGRKHSLYFLYGGIVAFFAAQISMTCWILIGERQAISIRREYFRALLRQEIGYFDKISSNELSTKVANNCQMIWQGIGEKVQTFIFNFVMIVTGFTIGFSQGWELS